jgi:hypothetical protein
MVSYQIKKKERKERGRPEKRRKIHPFLPKPENHAFFFPFD